MTSARLASLGLVLLLGCAPLLGVASCGGTSKTAGVGDDGGDDATADGTTDGNGGGHDGTNGDGSNTGDAGDGALVDMGVAEVSCGCPSTATCGITTDPCSGATILCGMPCPKGQICVGSGGVQSCQTQTSVCTGKCGVVVDTCGVAISCGGCPTGQDCVANMCVPQSSVDSGTTDACAPLTCTPNQSTSLCGTISDGCGHTKQCSCPASEQCIGGVCQGTPPECEPADGGAGDGGVGSKCGNVGNACGSGTVACGGCNGNTKCTGGTCTACTPAACGTTTCGEVSNGCGAPAMCGTCGSSEQCYDGGCCTPLTCAEAAEAGIVSSCGNVSLGCGVQRACAPCGSGEDCYMGSCCTPLSCAEAADAGLVTGCSAVSLGCGQQKSCAPCGSGMICQGDTCTTCVPMTCADYNNTGCNHSDGCGNTLNCCTGGTVCQGSSLCCLPGQVDYQGSCCQPQCDLSLPPGPQVVCGLTIYCGGTP
jgi:hypothetical protein